ncbi:MAG: hypothetical protein PHQ58_23525 [Rhodoferax sp.]|uniref:hypothetical protein n=1 Tax=Rhodoferax sp. TaxID=50421 RepID=UPI0026398443|nr:hypothetical protein [Rhodoferax sp.]MDD2883390.1 hypothetical protein [Rhodoferax sp.]
MSKLFTHIGNTSSVAALLIAALGGICFGFFSCGGYAWHREFFTLITVLITLAAVLAPGKFLRSWQRRAIFPFAVLITYVLMESLSAPFYPAPPESIAAYFKQFFYALEYGPC